MKYEFIKRLRSLHLVSRSDMDIHFSSMYDHFNSTRFDFTIVNLDGEVQVFVEIAWLEDVENDRYVFQVVEEYQNWMTDDDTEYKTYSFDRLIDNILELFEKFDIYPKEYLELL